MNLRTKLAKEAIELVYQARDVARSSGKLESFERRVIPHLDAVLKSFQDYHCRVPRTLQGNLGPPILLQSRSARVFEVIYDWYLWLRGLLEGIWYPILSFIHGNDLARPLWRTLYSLGEVYQHQGLSQNAEVLYRSTLADAWSRLPRRHPGPLAIVGDLAWSIYYQERYEESLRWYRWALDFRSKVLGKTHPATMGAFLGIGLVQECRGHYDEAFDLYKVALAGREKRLGRSDVLTLNVVGIIISLLRDTQSNEELLWREREYEWKNERSDRDPWSAYVDSFKIARVSLAARQYKKAKEWATKSLAMLELSTVDEKSNPGLKQELFETLGDICFRSAEKEEALQWYTQSLDEIRKECGCSEDDPDLASSYADALSIVFQKLGQTHNALRRYKEALDWFSTCLRIEDNQRRLKVSPYVPWLIQLYENIAICNYHAHDFNGALEWYARAYHLQGDLPEHLKVAYNAARDSALSGMAKSLERLERWDEATVIWQKILSWEEFTYGYYHLSTRRSVKYLAYTLFNSARYYEALSYGRHWLVGQIHAVNDHHLEVCYAVGFLGRVHSALGQYDEALHLLNAALEGKEQKFEYNHWTVLDATWEIARVYWLLEDYNRSFDWLHRALEADSGNHLPCSEDVRDFESIIDQGLNRDVEELRVLCERNTQPKVSRG